MSKFIYQQPTKNVGHLDIQLVLEIHKSLWLDDFKNYEIRDFLAGGRIVENPDILNGDESIIKQIRNQHYQVQPFNRLIFEKSYTLGGYMYLIDTENGIQLYHYEEPKKSMGN